MGRFIDKIHLRHAGQIQDYNYITVGFDKYLVDFLQIDPKAFEQLVLSGGTDEDLLAWMKTNSRPLSDQEIAQWSQGLLSSPLVQKTMRRGNAFRDALMRLRRSARCRFPPFLPSPLGPVRLNSMKGGCSNLNY